MAKVEADRGALLTAQQADQEQLRMLQDALASVDGRVAELGARAARPALPCSPFFLLLLPARRPRWHLGGVGWGGGRGAAPPAGVPRPCGVGWGRGGSSSCCGGRACLSCAGGVPTALGCAAAVCGAAEQSKRNAEARHVEVSRKAEEAALEAGEKTKQHTELANQRRTLESRVSCAACLLCLLYLAAAWRARSSPG